MSDSRLKRIDEVTESLRVKPGAKVHLPEDFDSAYKLDGLKRKRGEKLLDEGIALLSEYQDRLAAQHTHGVLVVLQALDAAGKDGTIRHVMTGVNPQGVAVHGFKVPSDEELSHDYLWRYAKQLPQRGQICIFNRSYYEEVLVVRVHPELLARQNVPGARKDGDIWKRRYEEINDFERHLTANGFRIVKLFLNISKEEQRRRFLRRIDLAEKNWKFSAHDVAERRHFDDYQKAFGQMLSHTSTRHAPWYVIPADHKWFERIAAAAVLVKALAEIDPQYPDVGESAHQSLLAAKADLEGQAGHGVPADPFQAELDAERRAQRDGKGHADPDAERRAEHPALETLAGH
ncbi:MAG: PPK2 family polyphosphate kinase [Jatrophihabitantaceae bacterium]